MSDTGSVTQLAEELRQQVLQDSEALVEALFNDAPAVLGKMAQDAETAERRYACRDCEGILRSAATNIRASWMAAINARLAPPSTEDQDADSEFSMGELSLQDPTELDRSILVGRAAMRAERELEPLLNEIRPRLDSWVSDQGAPFPREALNPQTVYDDFRKALDALDLDLDQFRVMLELFSSVGVPALKPVLQHALGSLQSHGVDASNATVVVPRPSTVHRPPAAPDVAQDGNADTHAEHGSAGSQGAAHAGTAPANPAGGTWSGGPGNAAQGDGVGGPGGPPGGPGAIAGDAAGGQQANAADAGRAGASGAGNGVAAGPSGGNTGGAAGGGSEGAAANGPGGDGADTALDPQTLAMLQQVAHQPQRPTHYGDTELAQDLQTMAQGQAPTGWSSSLASDSLRRAKAIGRVFNELQADRHIPGDLKPRFADMRFAVMKSALADANFFADADHPLRRLLNDLTRLAADSRLSSQRGAQNIAEMIGEIHHQFEVSAEKARPDPERPEQEQQANEEQIEAFLAEQKGINQKRRDELIRRSRELVQEELWLRTAEREIPSAGRRACAYGWVPMMALTLLRHGADSHAWQEGLDLLDRMVDGFDPRPDTVVKMGPLSQDLRRHLQGVGMVEKRIQAIVRDLIEGLCEGAGHAVEAGEGGEPAAPAPQMLMRKLLAPGQWYRWEIQDGSGRQWLRTTVVSDHHVSLEAVNGDTRELKPEAFIEEIRQARVEPVDPSPAVMRALEQLRQDA